MATSAFVFTEVKYMASKEAKTQSLWIALFALGLRYRLTNHLVSFKVDNRGAIILTANLEF